MKADILTQDRPKMSRSRLAALGLACLVSSACTVVVQQRPNEPEPAPTPRTTEPEPPPRAAPVRRGQRSLGIAPGHLPGLGYCRVWVEGSPPGQQARARACEGILPYAPEGSWILYRPASRQQEIRVRYLHERKHGMVVAVRVFEARSGRYLRDLALGEDDDNMGPAPPTVRRPATPVLRPAETQEGRRGNAAGQADTTRNRRNAGQRSGNQVQGNQAGQADTTKSDRGNAGENRGNAGVRADTVSARGQQGRRGGDDERGREADDRPGRRGEEDDTPRGAVDRPPLGVNARYLPNPGQCRVWVPGRPNGRQARARNCDGIANGAPAGAMILRRLPNQANVILVDYIDEARAGRIVRTSVYDASSGAFIRDEQGQRR